MPEVNLNEEQHTSVHTRFSLELVAMVAVIAISSWHIGNYMSTFDGWIMAAIMGATLGFCNFLCAHNIFREGSTSRFPSFVGLIFFAITSTWMQYTYFQLDANVGRTLLYGINLDALALGIWAPAAEILLGWIYAANVRGVGSTTQSASRWNHRGSVLVEQLVQNPTSLYSHREHSEEPKPNVQVAAPVSQDDNQLDQPYFHRESMSVSRESTLNAPASEFTKAEAVERLLALFADNPHLTYEQAASEIGRSKTTVSNYINELKSQGRIEMSKSHGLQIVTNGSESKSHKRL